MQLEAIERNRRSKLSASAQEECKAIAKEYMKQGAS